MALGYRAFSPLNGLIVALLGWMLTVHVLAQPTRIPFLLAVDPGTVVAGADAQVTVSGLFSDGDQVTVNGVVVTTAFVDSFTLVATIAGDQIPAPRPVEVRVQNASGRSHPRQLIVSDARVGFALGAAVPVPVTTVPSLVTVARLNDDSRQDLVLIGSGDDPRLFVAVADVAGGLGAFVEIPTGAAPTDATVADVDNDGDEDLLVVQGGAGVVTVLANDSRAEFTPIGDVTTGHSTTGVLAVADVDADGSYDFITTNTVENTFAVHLGGGDGTFSSQPPITTIAGPVSPVVGDLNGDGMLDVIVLSSQTGALARHLGDGTGAFAAAVNIPAAAGISPQLTAGDVNADGRLDLVFPRQPQFPGFGFPSLEVMLGQADGTFTPAPPLGRQAPLPAMRSVDLLDVDGDGDQDLVGVDALQTLYVFRGDRSGRLPLWTSRVLSLQPAGVVASELTGDGLVDFIVVGSDFSVFPAEPRLLVLPQTDPGPPPVLMLPDATFTEADGASRIVNMPVLLVDAAQQPVAATVPITFTLAFTDGSAEQGTDYDPSPATQFQIAAGDSEGLIDFRIVGGTTFEPTETFVVGIATVDGAVIGDGEATVTILDNDPPPPSADLVTTLTMDDDLGPSEPVTGTLTLRNNGPAAATNPTAAIQIDFFDLAKLTNIQIAQSTFLVNSVNGGLIRGQSLDLPPNQELSFTFTATPTAAAAAPKDLANTQDNARPFPLPYAFNQVSAAGRIGAAFDQAGDGKVNDLALFDPGSGLLRVVTNADGASQTQVADVGTAFPDYTVSSLNVCRLGGAAYSTAVMTLARNPDAAGDAGLVVSRNLSPDAPVAPMIVAMHSADSPFLGAVCDSYFVDGVNDLAAFGPSEVIVARNNGGVLIPSPPVATYTSGGAYDMVGGDFNGDGINDIAVLGEMPEFVIDGRVGAGTVLLPMFGDGAGGFTPQPLIDLSALGHIAGIVGGTGFDPVAGIDRMFDLNQDAFPDLVAACTSCAGGAYGVVPLRNLGAAAPGRFDVQAAVRLGVAGQPFGQLSISRLGTPLVNEAVISLTAKDGFNHLLVNDTPPNADAIALRSVGGLEPLAGSGPSAITPMNAFADAETDFNLLGLGGRVRLDVSGTGTDAVDPDQANNLDTRTIVFRPGRPDSHRLRAGARWEPNTLARLENTSATPGTNSLNGARVYVRDQNGNTADAQVLSSSTTHALFRWPYVPEAFKIAGAQLTLFAETAGGAGASESVPVVEPADLPVLTIADASRAEGNGVDNVAEFVVSLSAASATPVRVRVRTLDDKAIGTVPFGDFGEKDEVIEFAPGEIEKTFSVNVYRDVFDEDDETFVVRLSEAVGATIGRRDAIGTILDTTPAPQVRLTGLTATEGDAGTKRVAVTATLVGPPGEANEGQPTASGKNVALVIESRDQTAQAGVHYTLIDRVVSFLAGTVEALINIDLIGNTDVGPATREFILDVDSTNATIDAPDPPGHVFVIEDDDEEPPTVSVADVIAAEGATSATVLVTLSRASAAPVQVRFETADGTARRATGDYAERQVTVEFAPGQTAQAVSIDLFNDLVDEPDETFSVFLSDAAGAVIGREEATVTIVDDDEPPHVQFENVRVPEGDAGTARVAVTATLVGPPGAANAGQLTVSGKTVTLDVSARDNTATAGSDYSFLPKMFILAPGEGRVSLDLDVHGDTRVEGDESLWFDVVAINVTTPPPQSVTIADDDELPEIRIRDVAVDENRNTTEGPRVVTTVVLSKPSDVPVRVRFATADGTASLRDVDYFERTGVVEFPPGQTEAEIDTFLRDDSIDEPNETYYINLFDAVGATIADAQGEVIILDDDPPSGDTTPPTIAPHPTVRVPATSQAGAVVHYTPPIVSDNEAVESLVCDPPSGSLFRIGTTTVVCTATDRAGNVARSAFVVRVVVGRPRIETTVVGLRETAPGQLVADLAVRNIGTGHARQLRIFGVKVRALGGPGGAVVNTFGPADLGNLDVGETRTIQVELATKGPVARLGLTTEGTMSTVRLRPDRRFTAGASVTVSDP